jgi:signal transduction histidine kinase/HAMP domain-containing protein
MFFIKSLRVKSLLWTLIPATLVIVAAGIIGLYAYEQVARDVVQQRDTELARISAARLSEGLSRYSQILKTTVTEDDVRSMELTRLNSALEKAEEQLYVFDAGIVVYDSRGGALWSQPFVAEWQGTDYPAPSEFDKVRSTRHPSFSGVFKDEISGEHVILIGVPIVGSDDEFKGVLAGISTLRYSLLGTTYAEVLEITAGHSGFGYVVDGDGQVIYHRNNALLGMNLADTEPVRRATTGGEPGAVLTEDSAGEIIISGFAPVPGTNWRLITQERWESVVGPMRDYSRLLLALLVAGGITSGALIFFNIGRILKPVKDLTRGAQRIAGGDFDYTIDAETGDEIQSLAQQFNTMAGALKESYTDLEQKVEERTRGERRRAEQLRSINEVGRRISSILSLDELLPYVASSLQETFNYYNVSIFLLDPGSDGPVLKACAGGYQGSVPARPEAEVARGIVGWVAQYGEPLIVGDVSKEPKYLFIQELADTRSELAVPIRVGTELLGVLDIQSAELDAFDEVDLFTAQTLADQVAIAIENARLYQETREMAVIEERNRMAREIHDTLAQGFTGIVLQLEAAEQSLGENVDNAHEHLDHARRLARESLNEARRSVWALRPQTLEQLPLIEALRQEIEKFTRDGGIKASFSTSGKGQALHADMENALLRICQESLANAKKHAQAEQVMVNLAFEREKVGLSIRDNGIGFDPEVRADGSFGLIGMTERARLLGGTLAVQSEKGKGTLIEVMIPIA